MRNPENPELGNPVYELLEIDKDFVAVRRSERAGGKELGIGFSNSLVEGKRRIEIYTHRELAEGILFDYEIDSAPVIWVVGDTIIANSRLREKFEGSGQGSENVIWLRDGKGILQYPRPAFYSLITLDLLVSAGHLVEGPKVLLDIGSADGLQCLAAAKFLGVKRAFAVDRDVEALNFISRHWEVNGFEGKRLTTIEGNLSKDLTLISNQIDAEPNIAVANIGPWDSGSDLCAAELMQHLPSVKIFVAGGFCGNKEDELRDVFLGKGVEEILRENGFNQDIGRVVDDAGRIAFAMARD